jgi:hypothetical protein
LPASISLDDGAGELAHNEKEFSQADDACSSVEVVMHLSAHFVIE